MNSHHPQTQRGFSLIEIMVGMFIGLLCTIVIMQMFVGFEGQKRSTTGSADAQTSGAIAFYTIERDVRMAGYGFGDTELSCSTPYTYFDKGSATPGPLPGFSTTPVIITDGGTGSDAISIQYATSASGAIGTTLRSTMPQSSSELNVNSTYGCAVNDMVLVSQGNNCTLMQLTQVQDTALKLQHNPGGTPSYNPPAAYQNANSWPAYTTGAKVSCMSNIIPRTYAVNGSSLVPTATLTPLGNAIVNIQAQYGVAPAGSQQVNEWVNATGTWASPTAANIKRIKAIRLAVVARSTQMEKENVSIACTTTTESNPKGVCAWEGSATYPAPTIDLSNIPDWQRYRYKVFETIIPLKNVIWANI
jgi:type IV pilus assembly protein PilW